MKRNSERLKKETFDLIIIGGGVYGLCTAWDAALRGMHVAVLEKDDFTHASSAANYKLIHGGLRYLQHLDFKRMRVSIRERRHMMTMAPHLVNPVEFVIPCYGHGMKGQEVLWIALLINDLMGFDRNQGIEAGRRIPRGHLISKEECLQRIPGLKKEGLTGGAVYYDAQMYSAERLALSFGLSAAVEGACLLNYAEVTGMQTANGRVQSLTVLDKCTGENLEVKGHCYVNMTGPWSEIVRQFVHNPKPEKYVVRSKGVQFFTRQLAECGFTVETRQKDTTALIARGGRSLFVQPWRGKSFIGQSDKLFKGDPDDFDITEEDLLEFLAEFNEAYPYAALSRKDVDHWLGGMIPVGNDDPNADAANISHRYEILDHEREDGVSNLLSVIGVKFTISRYIAQTVVDCCTRKLPGNYGKSSTASRKVLGGDIEDVEDLINRVEQELRLSPRVVRHLVHLYGSRVNDIMALVKENDSLARCISGSDEMLRAEVLYAVREEMALHLDDVVLRRSDLGTLGYPGIGALQEVAELMAGELNWDAAQMAQEIRNLQNHYRIMP